MKINTELILGNEYSKKELSKLLEEPALAIIREGLYYCKNSLSTLLFCDLEKKGKKERFHFDDFFEGDFFHWDSQTTQHINSPKIQELITGHRQPYLFARILPKIKGQTQPFIYCGRLNYSEYELGTFKPVHIIFENIDYDDFTENEDLLDIYLWKPSTIGKSTKSKIDKRNIITERRKVKYKKPNETERKGMITSRVGQGYYRQQIVEKWGGRCPITQCDITEILISSHIVPWSESNDEERLDINNGILLSPNIDSLFDKHLISFDNDGNILISNRISFFNRKCLGLRDDIKISINTEMKDYLQRHRNKFNERY